jgi:hypothetical protein
MDIRPLYAYTTQICGPANPSNIHPVQAFQAISLQLITNAP